jgi:hypothetical protein
MVIAAVEQCLVAALQVHGIAALVLMVILAFNLLLIETVKDVLAARHSVSGLPVQAKKRSPFYCR